MKTPANTAEVRRLTLASLRNYLESADVVTKDGKIDSDERASVPFAAWVTSREARTSYQSIEHMAPTIDHLMWAASMDLDRALGRIDLAGDYRGDLEALRKEAAAEFQNPAVKVYDFIEETLESGAK